MVSFEIPEFTANVTGTGTVRLLDAIRRSGGKAKFYQASSSEMFGSAKPPQNEATPFHPRSPYGADKVYAYWITVNYREAYRMFATNGILFNHESPRRGETFVTRKISRAVAHIRAGKQDKLYLGTLDSKRDWGYAPEYVDAMWRILQRDTPEDFVLGTGESHSIREFVAEAFAYVGLDWNDYVRIDPKYIRPAEVDILQADPRKARNELDWEPKITFKELVRIMVDADMEAISLVPIGEGKRILQERSGSWHQWDNSVSRNLAAVAGAAAS
jgi:GDPmannose 4,6-dehydratase